MSDQDRLKKAVELLRYLRLRANTYVIAAKLIEVDDFLQDEDHNSRRIVKFPSAQTGEPPRRES